MTARSEVKVGNKDVFDSKTIIGIGREPIEFTLTAGSAKLVLRFLFEVDKLNLEGRWLLNAISQTEAEIRVINLENVLFAGNIDTIVLGSLGGRRLHFNFRVFSGDQVGRALTCTWYLGEKVVGG